MGCRSILAINSCHLSGSYKGALLFAIAYDVDDGMFLLAIGVVSSENYEDWYWFLEKLKGILDGKEVVIISYVFRESCVVFSSCSGQEIMHIVIDM